MKAALDGEDERWPVTEVNPATPEKQCEYKFPFPYVRRSRGEQVDRISSLLQLYIHNVDTAIRFRSR